MNWGSDLGYSRRFNVSRSLMIQIHLVIGALFLPVFLILPTSGVVHLLGLDGEIEKRELYQLERVPESSLSETEQKTFFISEFKERGVLLEFESIKRSSERIIFRPSSRRHLMAERNTDGTWTVFEVNPSFWDRLLELHKGHGPRFFKWVEIAFGFALGLLVLSGAKLALSAPKLRLLFAWGLVVGCMLVGASLI